MLPGQYFCRQPNVLHRVVPVYLLLALQVLKDPGYMEEVKRCTPMKRVGDPDEVAGE
jgi:hypothetical protein